MRIYVSEGNAEILATEKTFLHTTSYIQKTSCWSLYPIQILGVQTVWKEEIECYTLVCALIH